MRSKNKGLVIVMLFLLLLLSSITISCSSKEGNTNNTSQYQVGDKLQITADIFGAISVEAYNESVDAVRNNNVEKANQMRELGTIIPLDVGDIVIVQEVVQETVLLVYSEKWNMKLYISSKNTAILDR